MGSSVRTCTCLIVALTLPVLFPGTPARAERDPRELAREVLTLFETRCTECHDAETGRPRGGIGFIRDLKRVASDTTLIVPGDPEASELYFQVEQGFMPRNREPLTVEQVATLREWILAGAPADLPAAAAESPLPAEEESANPVTAESGSGGEPAPQEQPVTVQRIVRWLGTFHVLVIHFPIAFLVGAALAEMLGLVFRKDWIDSGARLLIVLGAPSALFAALLGWANAGPWGEDNVVLGLHRWLGIATALFAVALLCMSERSRRGGGRTARTWYLALLLIGALLVGLTGHFGGMMVFGLDYFAF